MREICSRHEAARAGRVQSQRLRMKPSHTPNGSANVRLQNVLAFVGMVILFMAAALAETSTASPAPCSRSRGRQRMHRTCRSRLTTTRRAPKRRTRPPGTGSRPYNLVKRNGCSVLQSNGTVISPGRCKSSCGHPFDSYAVNRWTIQLLAS